MVGRRAVLRAGVGGAVVAGLGLGGALRPGVARAAEIDDLTMRGVYEQIKTPYKHGMVVRQPAEGHLDSPSVFRHGGRWYMVYIVFRSGGYETLLARSDDLLSWEQLGVVLPFRAGAWDARQAAGYVALQDPAFGGSAELGTHDGRYWLTYLGGADPGYEAGALSIGVASTTTPDVAVPWERPDAPVLSPGAGARWWETAKLYKSTVVADPDRRLGAPYVMYYNAVGGDGGSNAGVERIGMATSSDMRSWTRYGADPVVVPDDTGYANRVVGDPQVIRVGDVWVMLFWARYTGSSGPEVFDSFACSSDLVTWRKWRGEVLLTSTEPYEREVAHKPWVVRWNGVTYHFYSAKGDEGWGIAVATSVDLRTPADQVTAAASYTFLYDSPRAVIDGTVSYDDSPRSRWTGYRSPNASDWVQVQFPSARTLSTVEVDFFTDSDAIAPPRSYTVEHHTTWGTGWTSVPGQRQSPGAPVAGTNTVTFDPVTTDSVRVFVDHPGGGRYAGITELRWR